MNVAKSGERRRGPAPSWGGSGRHGLAEAAARHGSHDERPEGGGRRHGPAGTRSGVRSTAPPRTPTARPVGGRGPPGAAGAVAVAAARVEPPAGPWRIALDHARGSRAGHRYFEELWEAAVRRAP
ncbi:hypothetical protein ABZ575_19445, partial [Streptomyces sp. NPDC018347]